MTTRSTSFTPLLFGTGQRARLDRAAQGAVLISRAVRHVARIFRLARGHLRAWNTRLNERAFLAGLQEYELRDMGLTLDQRACETNKPFWEA